MTTGEIVDEFLSYVDRHRSDATKRFYRQRLRAFRDRFGSVRFKKITSLEIDEHLHKVGENLSDTTRRHNIVAIQTMQNWAIKEKLIKKPVFEKPEKPRAGRRERIPTPEEIETLLKSARSDFDLFYRALMQCGARPGELCAMRIEEHVDWDAGEIVLKEHKTAKKTGKPRRITIGVKLEPLLREAIGDRTTGPVFVTARGKAWRPAHASAVHRRLRNRAGLPRDLVLYLARHRFGTRLIQEGIPLPAVAMLMGHSNITTTNRYVHLDLKDLRKTQDLV